MTERIKIGAQAVHSKDLYPAAVTDIEFDPSDDELPEPKKISRHLCRYILAQTVQIDNWQTFFGHFRFSSKLDVPSDLFHRTGHKWFREALSEYYNKPYDRLITFEWQHSTPNSYRIIKRGIRGCLDDIAAAKTKFEADKDKTDFLEAMEECCNGIIAWAHKCADACRCRAAQEADALRRQELLEAADILYRVPEYPAQTFREGLQTVWLCYQFLTDSIGTIDRYLYPLYKKDIESGNLSREQAKEYLQSLFILLQAQTAYTNKNHNRGGECHFAIGGYLPDGTDGFSELSRLIVEALMEMPCNIPEISFRWTKKTPRETLRYMLDCERHDVHKRIAFVSDEPRIAGFMKCLGISFEEACSYTMVGCNEPAFPGAVWFGGATVNFARSLEKCLYEGKTQAIACKTFDEFYLLWQEYWQSDFEEILKMCDFFNELRAKDCNVISSIFIDGCIESATPANRSGCRLKLGGSELMGIITVIDSLTVIKQFVFDEKTVSMEHLIEVLESNWEKDPDLRTFIYKKAKFFGNHEQISDEMSVRVTDTLCELSKDRRQAGGERILFGTLAGYNPHYAFFGSLTRATPDGRFCGDAFSVGSGQSFGRDREGLSSLLLSVAGMQPSGILCGPFLLNVSLDEQLVRRDEYFEKTVDMIETYFREGGMHIQLNYVSRETLLEARKLPEKYQNLKVRVSGYSDYFVNLREEIQDNVIARTVKES